MPKEITATVSLVSDMHFRASNAVGHTIAIDSKPTGEPAAGASPMELLLEAAGGCTAMDTAFILRKRRLPPDALTVSLQGVKRDTHPKIYEKIHITYRAKGPGITVAEIERAARLSLDQYCSVLGMLKQSAEITISCELME